MTNQTRPAPGQTITREIRLDKRAIDAETRTVDLAFASENPVERWYGCEVLKCDPANVRLDRLNNGGALLCNHDWNCQVGVVDRAACDGDKKARASVRFSRSATGEEMFQDVQDGIRTLVSVGYLIHAVEERTEANVTTYTVTDWEPYEISLVSVPADVSVGVGRSLQPPQSETVMAQHAAEPAAEAATPAPAPAVSVSDDNQRALQAERLRATRLLKLGAEFGLQTDAQRYLEDGRSVDDFMDHIVKRQSENRAKPVTALDLTKPERQRYSLVRAINAHLSRDWSKAGFERECSVEVANRLGKEARGFYVPLDIAADAAAASAQRRQQRTMSVGSDTAGGYLIDTENMYEYGIWIDNLRAQSVCMMLGAQVLDGLVGDVAIPRKTGSASFYWIGEDEDVTLTDLALGSVQLRNRTIAGGVPLTRKLLQQTSRAVETMVRADLTLGAALGIDNAILNGIGGKEPLGLYSAASVGTQAVATDGSPTWAETVGFESTVATANALVGRLAYLATPATRGNMKSTPKVANTSQFIWDGNEVNGYPAATTTQMPTNGLIFGDWSSVMVGFWGVLDLKPDEATKAASGGLILRVFQDADVALRHPEAFCKGT